MNVKEVLNMYSYPNPDKVRPAKIAEKQIYMKFCPNAKNNQEIYVSDGILEKVDNVGRVIGAANGQFGIVSHQPVFFIDFGNNNICEVVESCVICALDKELNAEAKKGDPCKLFWSKETNGFKFQFASINDATVRTSIIKCRICTKNQRDIDLVDGYKCMYCGNKWNPSFIETIKIGLTMNKK